VKWIYATIAAFSALHRNGQLARSGDVTRYTVETKAGILPIGVEIASDGLVLVVMNQGKAQLKPFDGDLGALAHVIGITRSDFHPTLPITYGSTGRWTLLVPVKSLEVMRRMRPYPDRFAAVLKEIPDASIHPFCFETIQPEATAHARHFSSPASVTLEDAVTGTASGVMGACFIQYVDGLTALKQPFVIEQGYEVNREGTVQVWASMYGDDISVRIAGNACFVKEIEVS
jgi:PhzF family phenazine biosynthesis protein